MTPVTTNLSPASTKTRTQVWENANVSNTTKSSWKI